MPNPPEHQHYWTSLIMHGDACHFSTTIIGCSCGARARMDRERDKQADPYEAAWFDRDCDRCRALDAGAQPDTHLEIIREGRRRRVTR